MTSESSDGWGIAALDLGAYLERIDHPRVRPSSESLRSLHEAHVRTIPFENVDVVLGTHPGIELGVISDKLVRRGRGGYCYEHALLFAAALEQLGFQVERRIARVQPHRSGPRTHMMLAVRVDGADFLADVGFGAGVLRPMPLHDGAIVDQAGWKHRMSRTNSLWTLEKQTAQGWEPLHASDESAQRPIDYEVAHHYVSTHPHSPFTGKLVVIRLDEGVGRRLVGDELTVEFADGRIETTHVAPHEREATLRELDVILEPKEYAALRDLG
ncbi:arylamine N-acetyltransferase family protein [Actinopolymorpha alba]|uniref:arylamine N-acetyltransferase family protein n=1 Tax=Actinopolymorpha alba TaxID=533267 RepID=UPI0012F633C1|nr:arylamine N-acetyltransferase [Actinopolymorpha alba]